MILLQDEYLPFLPLAIEDQLSKKLLQWSKRMEQYMEAKERYWAIQNSNMWQAGSIYSKEIIQSSVEGASIIYIQLYRPKSSRNSEEIKLLTGASPGAGGCASTIAPTWNA